MGPTLLVLFSTHWRSWFWLTRWKSKHLYLASLCCCAHQTWLRKLAARLQLWTSAPKMAAGAKALLPIPILWCFLWRSLITLNSNVRIYQEKLMRKIPVEYTVYRVHSAPDLLEARDVLRNPGGVSTPCRLFVSTPCRLFLCASCLAGGDLASFCDFLLLVLLFDFWSFSFSFSSLFETCRVWGVHRLKEVTC